MQGATEERLPSRIFLWFAPLSIPAGEANNFIGGFAPQLLKCGPAANRGIWWRPIPFVAL